MTTLKHAINRLGSRKLPAGPVRDELDRWRAELVRDLGGEAMISAQQQVVLDLAVRTHLLLESIDAWLLDQDSIILRQEKRLYPVVLERQRLADGLERYMRTLGLERRNRPVPTLVEYLDSKRSDDEAAS